MEIWKQVRLSVRRREREGSVRKMSHRGHEYRYGFRVPYGTISDEEKIAREAVEIVKKKASTFGQAQKVLSIMKAMLDECEIN